MRSIERIRALGGEGISSVEGLVALMIFATVILGTSAAAATANRVTDSGRRDSEYAAAVQYQLEILRAQGYDVTSGSSATSPSTFARDSVDADRHPMRWTVTGTDPKRILFISERTDASHNVVEDTTVLYAAAPAP